MAESYNTNLVNVASSYIKHLRIPVTDSALQKNLTENPYFPSLYSISNVFERFNIPHQAFKLDKEKAGQLPAPFIAYLSNQNTGKDFALVTSITQDEVHYIAESKKVKKVTKENFKKSWENIVLLAEPDENSGEKDYESNRKKEIAATNKTYALTTGAILIFLSAVYLFLHSLQGSFLMSAVALLAIKIFGIAATVLLLIYETDKSNVFVKSICTAGKQTNCGAVLQSKASKILGMSWSEVGFFYFASTFLFLLFPAINFATKIFVLSIANALAAPYIFFSVYYQWRVIKQWCPLCLAVQAILLMEFIWAITNFRLRLPIAFLSIAYCILPIVFCISLPIVLWYVLKPLILKAKDQPVYNAAYKRLLYNPDTFNNLLKQQASAPEGYRHLGIFLGNPNAKTKIIKVCNPYCGHCSKAHKFLDGLLHNNQDIQLQILFNVSQNKGDITSKPVKHFLAIAEKNDEALLKEALDDWYLSDKNVYEDFAAKYPMNGELVRQEIHIEKMSAWCKEANITGTPTLFINGHRLPGDYKIEELRYIL